MANYSTLLAQIAANIKTNNQNEITGQITQNILTAMVGSLGAQYQLVGVANPGTNPGAPDYNIAYFAATSGTYTYFNNIVVGDNEVCILKYNGNWIKETLLTIDATPILEKQLISAAAFSLETDPDTGEDWWICHLDANMLRNKYIILSTPYDAQNADGCRIVLPSLPGLSGEFCIFCENIAWGLAIDIGGNSSQNFPFVFQSTTLGVLHGTIINNECFPLSFSEIAI